MQKFMQRLIGVFAPNSKHRALVTPRPGGRGKGSKPKAPDEPQEQTPVERRASMTWAQRLKRVFDVETCVECGDAVKIIPKALATLAGQALTCIEDPQT